MAIYINTLSRNVGLNVFMLVYPADLENGVQKWMPPNHTMLMGMMENSFDTNILTMR